MKATLLYPSDVELAVEITAATNEEFTEEFCAVCWTIKLAGQSDEDVD